MKRKTVYLASPMPLYSTTEYREALRFLKDKWKGARIISPRDRYKVKGTWQRDWFKEFRSLDTWLKSPPATMPAQIDVLVFITQEDGLIGNGTYHEIVTTSGLKGAKLYWLTDKKKLVPYPKGCFLTEVLGGWKEYAKVRATGRREPERLWPWRRVRDRKCTKCGELRRGESFWSTFWKKRLNEPIGGGRELKTCTPCRFCSCLKQVATRRVGCESCNSTMKLCETCFDEGEGLMCDECHDASWDDEDWQWIE